MDAWVCFVVLAVGGLVLFIWGSLGLAAGIILEALAETVSPTAEPMLPAAGKDAEPTEAEERAWAERWAARAGR